MEWSMSVNDVVREEIIKINSNLIPPGFHGDARSARLMQDCLSRWIDQLGEESAAAQSLNKVITTAERLRNAPTHTVYLLKDEQAQGGKGELVGLLKVGRKHLFLFDFQDQVREVEPLCVLDFYVSTGRQRLGLGRRLFDHMLRDQAVQPRELAIDGPSPKMEHFLAKNYGVDKLVRQNNNFAITPHFFGHHANDASARSGRSTPAAAPAPGRFAAAKPHSSIASVIHGTAHAPCDNGDSALEFTEDEGGVQSRAEAEAEVREVEARAAEVRAERPRTLPVAVSEPPAAGLASGAGAPAAGLASGAGAPAARLASGAGTPAAGLATGAGTPAGSRRDPQLTDQGYFDVKFYHNKLW